jgi:hypothetical protein
MPVLSKRNLNRRLIMRCNLIQILINFLALEFNYFETSKIALLAAQNPVKSAKTDPMPALMIG